MENIAPKAPADPWPIVCLSPREYIPDPALPEPTGTSSVLLAGDSTDLCCLTLCSSVSALQLPRMPDWKPEWVSEVPSLPSPGLGSPFLWFLVHIREAPYFGVHWQSVKLGCAQPYNLCAPQHLPYTSAKSSSYSWPMSSSWP